MRITMNWLKKSLSISIITLIGIQSANACQFTSPVYTFVYQNDRDGDGKLNKDEWRNARLDDNLIAKVKLKKVRQLLKLDTNKNGVFDYQDEQWHTAFEYKINPCEYWQHKLNEYDQKHQE